MELFQNAKWIWHKECRPNQWLSFCKEVELSKTGRATVRLSVENKYWLTVNGTEAVKGVGLTGRRTL